MNLRQAFARSLRRNASEAEKRLWYFLRNRQLAGKKFRRQHIIGPYTVDFVCLEENLIIEVDGGQHAERSEQDALRTAFLNRRGFKVLRFWNNEVLQETAAVLEAIRSHLTDVHPASP